MTTAAADEANAPPFMTDFRADPETAAAWLRDADEAALRPYQLDLAHLNLVSVFGGEWSPERVRATAVECTRAGLWGSWEHKAFLTRHCDRFSAAGPDEWPRLCPQENRLRGWEAAPAALRDGPAILCSFHYGAFRFLASDLVMAGRHVTQPMGGPPYTMMASLLDGYRGPLADRFRIVSVDDDATGLFQMARALRKGEVVVVFVDGNRGIGGCWNEAGRVPLDFLGCPVRVKSGVARLAATLGVPLVPVLVPRGEDGTGTVHFEPVIDPGRRLAGDEEKEFVARAMAGMYAAFEREVRARPEQWEGSSFMHQWRVPANAGAEASTPPSELDRCLEAGGRLRTDPTRVVALSGTSSPVWTDVHTLKSFAAPEWAAEAFDRLSSERGIDRGWLAERAPDPLHRSKLLDLISRLVARRAVVVLEAA
ncbi:MAG: Signal transduction histidine kinase CheA [uncultured Gemmatimonadetes bacterium]|uniref:Signal transduction histidine kinase CheA n=1 Tax=uncultured Gemmatimonadota bacterium TaxID=203437 RepID=A0A6J4M1W2_9BACT|nr:MAG: Signal transduction histidine kinase CheA [uncultured Gemmatimonadota bacterium]